jgi:hypothetical protein
MIQATWCKEPSKGVALQYIQLLLCKPVSATPLQRLPPCLTTSSPCNMALGVPQC